MAGINKDNAVIIGRFAGVYGIKGWLKVISYTRPIDKILTYSPWYICRQCEFQEIRVMDSRKTGKSLQVALAGISDRDIARQYTGTDIFISRGQFAELPEGQYYLADMLNLQVINLAGHELGILQEIYETGANDVMVVQGDERHLIPLVWDEYLLDVDLEKGLIRVNWD